MEGIQNFDNNPMLSSQQTVSHTPEKFMIDFQSMIMQFDPKSNPTMVVNHKIVILDPHVIKSFVNALQENISRYEKSYGEIKKPASLDKAKELMQKQAVSKNISGDKPSYLG